MTQLQRGLNYSAALSLVVGSMIGTGVFLKTAKMAQLVPSPVLVLAAWGVAGLLSLLGALSYAEVGSRFPQAGGEYVYVREAYGSLPAFLYGWMRFWIGSPGSVAAYGVGAATFLSALFPLEPVGGKTLVAILFILAFTFLNCLTVSFGGRVQSLITAIKVFAILFIIFGIVFFSTGTPENFFSAPSSTAGFSMSAFGAAMLAALWAFDGWNNLPMVAGEVKNPQRVIPLALIVGTFLVFAIYATTNLSYFYALPFSEVLTSNSTNYPDALPVATKAVLSFLKTGGITLVSILFVISALGAMNGSILTGARVPYAMANDGLFFSKLKNLNPKTNVPTVSVLLQGIWACVLALSGTFDQLTDYVIFASWIFYLLVTASVFTLRKRRDVPEAAYRVKLFPWVPGLFCLGAVLLLINTLVTSPKESFIGLLFILIGVPVYYMFRAKKEGHPWRKAFAN